MSGYGNPESCTYQVASWCKAATRSSCCMPTQRAVPRSRLAGVCMPAQSSVSRSTLAGVDIYQPRERCQANSCIV